jgi:SAM-dependent methyltransferase
MDNFTAIPEHWDNADRWIIRKTILLFIRSCHARMSGRLLDVGCGLMPYRDEVMSSSSVSEYVGLDLERATHDRTTKHPDITWDGKTIPLPDESFDCALATEVFEHVPDLVSLLREIRRVLKPGGKLFFTTPFVWPYHETPNDHQRWTEFGLRHHLAAAGFHTSEIRPIGNWHSSLAQFFGLWVARAPMRPLFRHGLKIPVFLLQKLLMNFDGDSGGGENDMPRTIAGVASR